MDGYGKLYYDNDRIAYEGFWKNDEFSGQGKVYNDKPQDFDDFVNDKGEI